MRRLQMVIGLAVFMAAVAVGPPATAAETHENTAVVINAQDGTTLHEVAFMAVLTTGEVVDASNAAVALTTSCEACRSVAVAIQVLVASGPTQVTASNLSAAITELCDGCASIAVARQVVVATNTPIDPSPAVMRALDRLQRRLTTFGNVLDTPAGQRVPTPVILKKVERLERHIDRELQTFVDEIMSQLTEVR